MAQYIVTASQNLWDIAIKLYGTIEGAFDLFFSNSWLTMTTDLKPGMTLEYHDDFIINEGIVSSLNTQRITPANNERLVYFKEVAVPLLAFMFIPEDEEKVCFSVSGEGDLLIDWGDNASIETISLTNEPQQACHYFNNVVDKRRVRLYGNVTFRTLDITKLIGELYVTRTLVVDEFISKANSHDLSSLLLLDGTYLVDLRFSSISTLSPIFDMNLQELNLIGCQFTNVSVLDEYLINLVENYQDRRNCKVYIDTYPSEAGFTAINTIINTPEWNQAGKWEFHICGTLYTATDGTNFN